LYLPSSRAKQREKVLEQALAKLAGENWQVSDSLFNKPLAVSQLNLVSVTPRHCIIQYHESIWTCSGK